jgi:hypothetical protein
MVKISVKSKSRGRPATRTEPLYGVRIADSLIKQIMEWAKVHNVTRSEAIRRLAELGLMASTPRTGAPAKTAKRAVELASKVIDERIAADAPEGEREVRKRRLLKGPSAFLDVRKNGRK